MLVREFGTDAVGEMDNDEQGLQSFSAHVHSNVCVSGHNVFKIEGSPAGAKFMAPSEQSVAPVI